MQCVMCCKRGKVFRSIFYYALVTSWARWLRTHLSASVIGWNRVTGEIEIMDVKCLGA